MAVADVISGSEAVEWLANWLRFGEQDIARVRASGRDSDARANIACVLMHLPPRSTWDPHSPDGDASAQDSRLNCWDHDDWEAAWSLGVFTRGEPDPDKVLRAFVPSRPPCRGTFLELITALSWIARIEHERTTEGRGRRGRPNAIHRRGVLRAFVEAARRTRCFNAGKERCARWKNAPDKECGCEDRGANRAVALILWALAFGTWDSEQITADWLLHTDAALESHRTYPGSRIEISSESLAKMVKEIGNKTRQRDGEYREYTKPRRDG